MMPYHKYTLTVWREVKRKERQLEQQEYMRQWCRKWKNGRYKDYGNKNPKDQRDHSRSLRG
jgi:hypothetical protein